MLMFRPDWISHRRNTPESSAIENFFGCSVDEGSSDFCSYLFILMFVLKVENKGKSYLIIKKH
jgi:hypothetical protein